MHDASTLRAHFPEFADTTAYPDASIAFWFTVADLAVPSTVWGELWDQGCELYVGHHLAIAARDQQAVEAGGVPGEVRGPQTAKSVDKVSVAFDSGAVTHAGAGFWNMTTYGIRFYNLVRIVGAGGIQL